MSNGAPRRRASSARRADAGPAARVRPRAGGAVLDVRLSDRHVAGDGDGVSVGRRAAGARRASPPGAASDALRKALAADRRHRRCARCRPDQEQRALREGDVHVIVRPADPPTYRFDPARAESRIARLVVDDALKRAGGRSDPWQAREEPVAVPGSRYIDWLIPGIIGAEHHEQRDVGRRVLDRPGAHAQAAEAHGGEPDAEARVPAGAGAGAAAVPRARSRGAAGVRRAGVRHADPRLDPQHRRRGARRRAGVRRDRPAARRAARGRSRRSPG